MQAVTTTKAYYVGANQGERRTENHQHSRHETHPLCFWDDDT